MNISVVIPAYNASSTIIKSITSVKEQVIDSSIKIEIIIIDDGSIDNTAKLVNDYISNNHDDIILISKVNGGVSKARNEGIKSSSGEWIAFLDADDVWLPDKLQKQINIINDNDNVNFIGCARNNESLTILGKKIDKLYHASCEDLFIKMFPQTSTALVRKSILDSVGYYDESMTHSEDGELWVRICFKGGFYYLPDSLVITGNGKQNFGDSGLSANLKKMFQGNLKILEISKRRKVISKIKYIMLVLFYYVKYIRRLTIVKLR